VTILVAVRAYLPPKEMAGAWRDFSTSGERDAATLAARRLEPGQRFDLVVEPEHAGIQIARDERRLLEAVRHPSSPRPVVVLDLAERIGTVGPPFGRIANRTTPTPEGAPGRPRSADRRNVSKLQQRPR